MKKILSSVILASPIAFLAACYGPMPYDCKTDNDCDKLPDGYCSKSAKEKEGYCHYGVEESFLYHEALPCKTNDDCKEAIDGVCGYIDKNGQKHDFCYSECAKNAIANYEKTGNDDIKCSVDANSDANTDK